MNNPWANIVGQPGTTWSQPPADYSTHAQQRQAAAQQMAIHAQQQLHPMGPGMPIKELRWMFDAEPLDITDFAQKVYGEDDAARSMFLLKYNK
jgi:hypothetical protein